MIVIDFPAVADGEPVTVSATLYRTFLQCPQQALGRMHGEYPPESRASFRGSLAHRLFAKHLSVGPIDAGSVEQVCREEIGSGLNMKLAALGITKPSELRPLLAEVGDLYDRFRRFPGEGFLAAEVALESEPVPGITLRGMVDAVFDDPEHGTKLIDWKTGSVVDAGDQLDFYALAWDAEHGALPGWVEAVSVKTGERSGFEPTVTRGEETARRVAELVAVLRAAFAAGEDLERAAGPHCRWCPLLVGCQEGASAVQVNA